MDNQEQPLKGAPPHRLLLASLRRAARVLGRLAPDPVARSVAEARSITSAEAWGLWAWLTVLVVATTPWIEYRMVPLLWRTGGASRQVVLGWHGLVHAAGLLAASWLALHLVPRPRPPSHCAPFLATLATGPVWLALLLTSLLHRWDSRVPWELAALAACVSLFCLFAVFTRAWGTSDRRATLLVPLLLASGVLIARMVIHATA